MSKVFKLKKKIVYIISDSGTGGGQVHLLDTLKNINREKFQTIIICDNKGHYIHDFQKYADKYFLINFESTLKATVSIWQLLKQLKPDIVHNHLLRACIIGGFIGRLFTHNVLNHLHGSITDDFNAVKWKVRLYIYINKFLNRLGCHYIAVSEDNKKQLIYQGIKHQTITTIYNGIDSQLFSNLKPKTPSNQPFKGLCIARLAPPKGIFTLLKIAKKLEKEVIIDLVGDGELKEEVEAYITKYQIKNINLLGFRKDVLPFLQRCDFFILTSEWESMGIVILEAMAFEKPIIASNVGGIPELVSNGKGGFLCEPNDIDDFVAKIRFLQKKPHLIKEFGVFNRKRFEDNFTLKQMVNHLETLYES